MTEQSTHPAIPVVDVREGGAVRHALENVARVRALREECMSFLPRAAGPLVPVLDRISRHWLTRSPSPYVAEVAAIAAALDSPGVWFLNSSYQWGCTTLAREEGAANWLARTLDWPFRGIGRNVEVAHMGGPAGDFFSITWPGYVGVLTAMAPGRFAAAVNQAPMWRRTRQRWLRFYDAAANVLHTWFHIRHVPPDHLLRDVFENCGTFAEAKARLESVPVARPVIYTLVGSVPGERCVIERTEDDFTTRSDDTCVANDWLSTRDGWEARIGGRLLFTSTFAEAAGHSDARRRALGGWNGALAAGDFDWVAPPVLNPFTRLAAAMCPAEGTLRVIGYEPPQDGGLPQPATRLCEVRDTPTAA